jgi:hypothetical protein
MGDTINGGGNVAGVGVATTGTLVKMESGVAGNVSKGALQANKSRINKRGREIIGRKRGIFLEIRDSRLEIDISYLPISNLLISVLC